MSMTNDFPQKFFKMIIDICPKLAYYDYCKHMPNKK